MQDVIMRWKTSESSKDGVYGVGEVEIPQFNLTHYQTVETVENLTTGQHGLAGSGEPMVHWVDIQATNQDVYTS